MLCSGLFAFNHFAIWWWDISRTFILWSNIVPNCLVFLMNFTRSTFEKKRSVFLLIFFTLNPTHSFPVGFVFFYWFFRFGIVLFHQIFIKDHLQFSIPAASSLGAARVVSSFDNEPFSMFVSANEVCCTARVHCNRSKNSNMSKCWKSLKFCREKYIWWEQ